MILKQISVFAENRQGSIREITSALDEAGVNIRALCIADTTDFGVVRMLVDKRKDALKALRDAGKTVKETDVTALAVEDSPGSFHKALGVLTENGINIEYCYGFVAPVGGGANIILRCDDQERADRVLSEKGFRLLTAEDIKY